MPSQSPITTGEILHPVVNLMWRIDYRDGSHHTVPAATATEALAVSADEFPDAFIDAVQVMTVSAALFAAYGDRWADTLAAVAELWSPETGRWSDHERLTLRFATAVDEQGRIDAEGLANFRVLRHRWHGADSVRFSGGQVTLRTAGPAPADLVDTLEYILDMDSVLDQQMYAAVRLEYGITADAAGPGA
ncbi:hypothetical protein [Nocardia sp. BMG111209]|uniref:hypothetical protein n=1 Tax=Nocardia sp. BMG111209 TaxID=1160137 RepID=UPI00035F283F|nr:hypothetical protein [Nocardia sp. BMG111209]